VSSLGAYKKITELVEVKKLLSEVLEHKLPFRIIRKNSEGDFYSSLVTTKFDDSTDSVILVLKIEKEDQKEFVTKAKNFLSFFVDRGVAYYFKFVFTYETAEGVAVKMPHVVFRVQRRKYFRVDVFKHNVKGAYTEVEKPKYLIVRNLIDVGIGGCAIQITPEEASKFEITKVLHGFKLKLGPNHYVSPVAAIRFIGVVTLSNTEKVYKCGLEFVSLSPQDEKDLSYYVYSLQRKDALHFGKMR